MQLPQSQARIADRLASALAIARGAMAKTADNAREWMLVGDADSKTPQLPKLTEDTFAGSEADIVGDWSAPDMPELLQALHETVEAAGFAAGHRTSGFRAHGRASIGRYACVHVLDPVLGNFVVRLWLVGDWEKGAELLMGAYRPVAPAKLMRNPPKVEAGALALVSLGSLPLDWSALTAAEAKAAIWQWLEQVLASPGPTLAKHWAPFHVTLDAARAP
jgi:hypothetical protein